jgi:hypothetical protein
MSSKRKLFCSDAVSTAADLQPKNEAGCDHEATAGAILTTNYGKSKTTHTHISLCRKKQWEIPNE